MGSELDTTFGATYIGVVLATFLYGILTLQTYIYWVRYVHDSLFDRLFVVVLWGIDTLQLAAICHMQYHYVITNYMNPAALQFNNWSLNMEVGLTAIITFMVQGFFARRAWYFTSRVGSRTAIDRKTQTMGVVIGLISLTQLGFGMGCFGMVWVLKTFESFLNYKWLVAGWLASAATCDVLIVFMLSTALMTQRTGFGRTDALIDKLLRYTINTGLLTSIIAIVDLIAFCTMSNLVHFCFNFILGKLYTNTLLATLNARDPGVSSIVHVESGSYKLDKVVRTGTSATMYGRGQERSEPVIHLHTDTEIEVSHSEPHHRSHDQTNTTPNHMVVFHGNASRDDELDMDGSESMGSIKRSQGL